MRVLFIVSNLWIFLEEFSLMQQLEINAHIDVYVDPEYNKDPMVRQRLYKCIFTAFPEIKKYTKENNYDIVVHSSYLEPASEIFVKEVSAGRELLVEDGTYDYLTSTDTREVYVISPSKAKSPKAKKLYLDYLPYSRIIQYFIKECERIMKAGSVPVLFTTPLKEDFGIENFRERVKGFFGDKPFIIKPHPRDLTDWQHDLVIPRECPGQIVDLLMLGDRYYLFPSTTGMWVSEKKTLIALPEMKDKYGDVSEFDVVIV